MILITQASHGNEPAACNESFSGSAACAQYCSGVIEWKSADSLKFRYAEISGVSMEAVKVGKRGTIVVPAKLRKRYGIKEGMLVTTEAREDGVLIRPAVAVPVERYTPERKAEFLLSTATTDKEYQRARKEVRKLGFNPDAITHRRPQ